MDLDWDRTIKTAVLKTLLEKDTTYGRVHAEETAEYLYDNWETLDRIISGKVVPDGLDKEVRYVRNY